MWSDDLDNEMRRAAQEEGAGIASRGWEKMEVMLDEHLPVEKKKRRFIFFWWVAAFLLIGGTAYLLLRNHTPVTENKLATDNGQSAIGNEQLAMGNKQSISPEGDTFRMLPLNKDDQMASSTKATARGTSAFFDKSSEPVLITNGPVIRRKKRENDTPVSNEFSVSQNAGTVGNTRPAQNNTTVDDHLSSYNNGPVTADFSLLRENLMQVRKILLPNESLKGFVPHVTVQEHLINPDLSPYDSRYFAKKGNSFPVIAKTKKEKPAAKNKLSLLLSAGPDLSSIGSDKQGRWKMQTGIGIQYQLNKRFSLRTGFYASRKIYEVKPKDYNPPAYFWQYYPQMQKIDADCKVYEIPVTLVFNVTNNPKNNFYVTAGSSTYIMNKEVYGYTYKDNLGYDRYAERTAPEKEINYFSTIGLSAGYSRQLSKRLAVSVEPYLKIPVSGIGYGKVKLTSGGALINGIIRLGKN